jgi:hypothetical protein
VRVMSAVESWVGSPEIEPSRASGREPLRA